MTPAIRAARAAGIAIRVHTYDHDPSVQSYGEEAASALGVDPGRVYKTLVARLDKAGLVVAIVPVLAGWLAIDMGISSAITEITAGVLVGYFIADTSGMDWLRFFSNFGLLGLMFMAAFEVDVRRLRTT